MGRKRRLDKYNETNSKHKIINYTVLIIILCVFIFIGISLGIKSSGNKDTDFKGRVVDTTSEETVDTIIFIPENDKIIPKKVRIIDNKLKLNNKLDALVKLLISKNYLPKGTHLIGNVNVEDGVAYCNFSKEIKNFSGSSNEEALLLESIGKTMISKEDYIKSIQILVQGDKIESLGGHLELSEPYSPY